MSPYSTASFELKWRKNVRCETSAASAMCSVVVSSKPWDANRRAAWRMSSTLVRCFLRSRRPGTTPPSISASGPREPSSPAVPSIVPLVAAPGSSVVVSAMPPS